jgi:hypothetical protein
VEALLLVPAPDPEAPEPAAKPAPKPETSAPKPAGLSARRARRLLAPELTAPPVADGSRTGIEFSLATAVRLGDGQSSIGLGALSFLELSSWLLGLGLRTDRYEAGSDAYAVMELMALFGHRFRVQRSAIDVIAGPALVVQADSTVEVRPAGEYRETRTEPVPRFVVGGHVHFGPASSLHPFLGIEAELGPSTVQEPSPLPRELPTWTLGLALGASVGTR